MGIVKAILTVVLYPVIGGAVAIAFSLFMHWISGEGNVRASGDPWMMVGVMLIFPVAVLVGFVLGVAVAISQWNGWR